jgi:hypothetical protein
LRRQAVAWLASSVLLGAPVVYLPLPYQLPGMGWQVHSSLLRSLVALLGLVSLRRRLSLMSCYRSCPALPHQSAYGLLPFALTGCPVLVAEIQWGSVLLCLPPQVLMAVTPDHCLRRRPASYHLCLEENGHHIAGDRLQLPDPRLWRPRQSCSFSQVLHLKLISFGESPH